jgi:hypothetical protein
MVILAILPACSKAVPTVDTYAIYTAAANTVQAELTNAALLTPSPTATATATETPPPTPDFTTTPQFSATPQMTATTGQLMDKLASRWQTKPISQSEQLSGLYGPFVTSVRQNGQLSIRSVF